MSPNSPSPVKRTSVCNGNPPVLILGYRRIENLKEVGGRLLKDSPCCIHFQIDGGSFSPNSQEILELRKYFDTRAGSTKISLRVEPRNLGIAKNLMRGMETVFLRHDTVVVLEDDCFPAPVFYHFMSHSLSAFQDNPSIGMISGNAYVIYPRGPLFSEVSDVPQTWGWATWKSVWKDFDPKLSKFTVKQITQAINSTTHNPFVRRHWKQRTQISIADANMWDAQWTVYLWMRELKTINPSENLVSNRGVDGAATHTLSSSFYTEWPTSTRKHINSISKELIASPVPWNKWRKFIHMTLLRIHSLAERFQKNPVSPNASTVTRLAFWIATRRSPTL